MTEAAHYSCLGTGRGSRMERNRLQTGTGISGFDGYFYDLGRSDTFRDTYIGQNLSCTVYCMSIIPQ